MTHDKTGIAILGAGRWGVHLIRNFLTHPQAHVLAVVDPHQERLSACRERFKLDANVVLATDWSAVRQLPGLEAVVIVTPAVTHYPLIADALQLGYHVLAEKPLTLNHTEALELCQLAAQRQRQLVVDQTYLFHPAVKQGKTVIQDGKLGELRYGYAARTHLGPVRSDVDAMWDLAIHDIAIFNSWLSATPIEVQATGTVWLQGAAEQGLRDLVWVTLTYPNGIRVFIHLCWLNPDKQRRLCLVGNQGTLIFDELQSEAPLTLQTGQFQETPAGLYTPTNQSREIISLSAEEPLARVCGHFLDCIQKNQSSEIAPGEVGAQLVQILSCLNESLVQGGQAVKVPSAIKNV